ncbi:MAG: hypothetical protein FWD92_06200 [Methanomassiliicoccaceae archaeon]|nr:hypothetical protein [Methanomassiliicoccaceae archaeon]
MNIIDIVAIVIGTGFFVAVLFMLLRVFSKTTRWNLLAMGAIGICLAICIDNFVNLYRWIELGITFASLGATMFVMGMLAMSVVMIKNFTVTKGRALVR